MLSRGVDLAFCIGSVSVSHKTIRSNSDWRKEHLGSEQRTQIPEVTRDGGDCSVTLEEIFFSLSGTVELGRGEHPIAKGVYPAGSRERGLPSDVAPFPPPVPHEAWRPPAIQHWNQHTRVTLGFQQTWDFKDNHAEPSQKRPSAKSFQPGQR